MYLLVVRVIQIRRDLLLVGTDALEKLIRKSCLIDRVLLTFLQVMTGGRVIAKVTFCYDVCCQFKPPKICFSGNRRLSFPFVFAPRVRAVSGVAFLALFALHPQPFFLQFRARNLARKALAIGSAPVQ